MTYTGVNSLNDSIEVMTTTKSMTRLSKGSVMCRKRCIGPAPSRAADSYRSDGIACRPPRNINILKPTNFHTPSAAMLNSASSALLRNGCGGRPTVSKIVLNKPDSADRNFQIVALTTNEATTRRKKEGRKKP